MRRVCVSRDVDPSTLSQLETLIVRARKLRRGELLYLHGHALHNLFAVRSGAVKAVMHSATGDEQIVAVYRPGDPAGLDALGTGDYAFDAIALEDTSVCLIPYDTLWRLCLQVPAIQQRLTEILGAHLLRNNTLKMLCCLHPIEARVLAFLMECSRHSARLGYASNEFSLSMTRAELGNYLGTTMETISRLMSACERDGLIQVKGRRICIPDLGQLEARLHAIEQRTTRSIPYALNQQAPRQAK